MSFCLREYQGLSKRDGARICTFYAPLQPRATFMTHSAQTFRYNNTGADFDPKGTRERAAVVGCVGVRVSTAVGGGVERFDVRQAARGAIAPSRPHVGSFADCSTAQRNRPAIRLDGGARVRRAAVNAAIVHGCLNGTYYLITYDGFLARALSLAHGVPAAAR